jgi:hypothetical protein
MGRKRRNRSTTVDAPTGNAPRGNAAAEPYWAPLARQKLSTTQTVSIIARHVVPLAGLWWFGGSVENFLLLSVFNIAFTIACIAVVGLAVSTRQINGDQGAVDSIGALLTLIVIGAIVTLVLTVMFGWVIALIASESALGLWNAPLGWSVLTIIVVALPDMVRQYREDMAAKLPEEERKKRDQPVVGGLFMCAGLIFVVSGYAGSWGRFGVVIVALLVTGLFIFRDLRPDLMRELTRPSNRPPSTD